MRAGQRVAVVTNRRGRIIGIGPVEAIGNDVRLRPDRSVEIRMRIMPQPGQVVTQMLLTESVETPEDAQRLMQEFYLPPGMGELTRRKTRDRKARRS